MSERLEAELERDSHPRGLYDHRGDAAAPLGRWRRVLRGAWADGPGAVKALTPHVMKLIADPRVLHPAALDLRARGPKATVAGGIPVEILSGRELWELCKVLGAAIAGDRYSPGREQPVKIPKASGGTRTLVLMDGRDRVVQKAASLVLRPLLDPHFDPRSFAGRPRRTREQALAVARDLTLNQHPVWLTHDLRDAFGSVPLDRLIQLFFQVLPCERLSAFLTLVLPPQSRSLGGLKQGGPLSPLALEFYLCRVLDRPFRKAGLGLCHVRFVDDFTVLCPNPDSAAHADAELRRILTPSGMLLKHPLETARRDLREAPAAWLGFQFHLDGTRFRIGLGDRAFDKLAGCFRLADAKDRPSERAIAILKQWTSQLGPCGPSVNRPALCDSAVALARSFGFEEKLPLPRMLDAWEAAGVKWTQTCKGVRKQTAYFESAPVRLPTPLSNSV